MVIVASGIAAHNKPDLDAVVKLNPYAMKNGKIAKMPSPMNIIPIRSFLEGEMLSTLLAQKKKRIIPTIP